MELSLESAESQYKEVERVPCKLTGLPGDLVEGRSRGRGHLLRSERWRSIYDMKLGQVS